MGLVEKIKLLFKARQPVTDLITELKGIKTGFATWQFWITFGSSIIALIAALGNIIPLSVATAITVGITVMTSLYDVYRGALKSQVPGQKPFFQTSEFYASIAAVFSTAIVSLQAGGINPAIFKTALTAIGVILTSLGAGQNLAGQQPSPGFTPALPSAK